MLHLTSDNHDCVRVEDEVVGVLVTEPNLRSIENEVFQLQRENKTLRDRIRRLKQDILAYELQTGERQEIDPPGDFGDYPFSEN